MLYTGFVIILIIFILAIFQVIEKITGNSQTNLPNSMIVAGLTLLTSIVPSFNETIVSWLNVQLNIAQDPVNPWLCIICGFILIIFGIILRLELRNKIFILNMYGVVQRDISDKRAIKDLKLSDYKIKEQIININPILNIDNVNDNTNKIICDQIKEEVTKFASRTEDRVSCFTGMAPIPYTVLAGTYLSNANVKRYFEYNRHNGGKYYEIHKAKFWQKKRNWPGMNLNYSQREETNATDVVLAISISHDVINADLKQFENLDILELKLDTPQDNVIEYYEQLLEYSQKINKCIDVTLKEKYPKLNTIHIAASIPSCVAVELGKSISMGTNRMANIIVYHYVSFNEPKYKFGIYVNGAKKGKLL